jgi:hypothetical protein
MLTRLPEHEKRAYLAKFLVPFQVHEEISITEEMKGILD